MRKILPFLILLSLLLAACGGGPGPAASATNTSAAAQQPTDTPSPTPVPEKLLFATAGEAPKELVDRVMILASELAADSGWKFESRLDIKLEELGPEVRGVVWVYPPDKIKDIAAASPSIIFLAVTPGSLPAAANLGVVQMRPENAAFLAGYIAVLSEIDWRAGGLFSDDETGKKLGEAFQNGGRYWCGRCAPTVPPFYDQRYADNIALRFPTASFFPADAPLDVWQPELNGLQANIISTLYVSPEVASPTLLGGLGDFAWLMGSSAPPEGLRERWLASVREDPETSLQRVWADLLAGKGGQAVNCALAVDYVNTTRLSDARLRLVDEVRRNLEEGLIGAVVTE